MSGRPNLTGKLTVHPKPPKNRNSKVMTTLDFVKLQEHLNKIMESKRK